MTTTQTTTARDTARAAVIAEVGNRITKEHERNFHRLHVWRDGSISWREYINESDDTIDRHAASFQPVPSVALVGTGSCKCNCDWCADGGTIDVTEIDGSALDDTETDMLAHFDEIQIGYFNDEETPE